MPVDETDVDEWHRYDFDQQMMTETRPKKHRATVLEYLEIDGFTIPIEEGLDAEANKAITSEGSFYSHGPAGRVTISDPVRGKVYFAYAG